MIRGYSDHAANERTFLAWVRTGLATAAFGLVIEKFNLFVRALATGYSSDPRLQASLERMDGALGRYDGFGLILVGIGLVAYAAFRFLRTRRLLDDPVQHAAEDIRAELFLSGALVLLVFGIGAYMSFD